MLLSAFILVSLVPRLVLCNALPLDTLSARQMGAPGHYFPVEQLLPGVAHISPNGDSTKCLAVSGNTQTDGTAVEIALCDGSLKQRWVVPVAGGSARSINLAGTNYCLDAGSPPFKSDQLRIWPCNVNFTQQQWVYTDKNDSRFALYGQNPGWCLGAEDGRLSNAWVAGCGGENQQWTMSAL